MSAVKWPVTGAFSKWNQLDWPYEAINFDLFDVFRISLETACGSYDYANQQPNYIIGDFVLYERGVYNPAENEGVLWVDQDSIVHFNNECNHVANPGITVSVIRECPQFDLPEGIQLRISLIRVKEN
jgi:hypothetical protein